MASHVRWLSTALLLCGLLLAGCDGPRPDNSGPTRVFVSIPPLVFFAEQIGGDLVTVKPLVEPGANPHNFSPTPKKMTELAQANLYLAIGVEFETALLSKLHDAYPNLTIVPCQAGVPPREHGGGHAGHSHAHGGHSHGAGGHQDGGHTHAHDHRKDDHGHQHAASTETQPTSAPGVHSHDHHHHSADPHVWLDPIRAKRVARNVCAALQSQAPQHGTTFLANLDRFEAELDALHAKLGKQLKPFAGRSIFVYHPAYGYFTDLYGLEQVPVEIEGRSPTAAELETLLGNIRDAKARVIYYEPQFDRANAELLAKQLGIDIAPLDPLAADYLVNLQRIADALVAGWSAPS